jgi:hypothetical protein
VSYTVLRVVPAELLVVSGALAAASALLMVILRRQRAEATVFSPP